MKKHNACIARSGVQYYLDTELPGLKLRSIPREYSRYRVFAVYRPSYVLDEMGKKFQDVPIRIGHKWVDNFEDPDIIGKVKGDVQIKHLKNEVALYAPLEIEDGIELPDFKELSPGYVADNIWQKGTTPSGEEYQILCTGIEEVNHLAILEDARGGEDMKILDGGLKMAKVHSGLIHTLRQKVFGVKDGNDENSFGGIVEKLKKDIASLSTEQLEEHSKKLIGICDGLPDSEQKDKLKRYIADIPLLKAEDKRVADEALNLIGENYRVLDSDAVADILNEDGGESADDKDKDKGEDKKDGEPADDKGAQDGEESKPADDDAKGEQDEDPIKKLCDTLETLTKEVSALRGLSSQPQNASDGGVNDGLPQYTQSLSAIQKGYDLDEEFNRLKNRRS